MATPSNPFFLALGRPFVDVAPGWRDFLRRQGWIEAGDFLNLSAAIVSGHPGRSVARIALSDGNCTINVYLKREYRVSLRTRLGNAAAGFGFVSGSLREARILDQLGRAGVGRPERLAAGEDGRGRAFLLVRETPGMTDLRTWLGRETDPTARLQLAKSLGAALARMHAAGITHPDLYAKHVLVAADGATVQFLDWQRSRRAAPPGRTAARPRPGGAARHPDRRPGPAARAAGVSPGLCGRPGAAARLPAADRSMHPPAARPPAHPRETPTGAGARNSGVVDVGRRGAVCDAGAGRGLAGSAAAVAGAGAPTAGAGTDADAPLADHRRGTAGPARPPAPSPRRIRPVAPAAGRTRAAPGRTAAPPATTCRRGAARTGDGPSRGSGTRGVVHLDAAGRERHSADRLAGTPADRGRTPRCAGRDRRRAAPAPRRRLFPRSPRSGRRPSRAVYAGRRSDRAARRAGTHPAAAPAAPRSGAARLERGRSDPGGRRLRPGRPPLLPGRLPPARPGGRDGRLSPPHWPGRPTADAL